MLITVTLMFILIAILSNTFGGKIEAPMSPLLSQSNWPIAHSSTWNSDVSGQQGPGPKDRSIQLVLNGESVSDISQILLAADSITLTQSSVDGYSWGSGVSGIYQIYVNVTDAVVVNTLFRDVNFEYHGSYSLLTKDGTYYAAAKTSLQAYNNEVPFDFTTPIKKVNEFFVTGLVEGEHIVGLTISFEDNDAYLIYATTLGKVGAVSLDFKRTSNTVQITGNDEVALPSHFISNSIAFDGDNGGIYACTSKSMIKLNWNGVKKTISNSWRTDYGDGADDWHWGRLGPGCGTSPTIMGPSGKPEYVVITDGENPMNIRFYNVHSGKEVGKHTVSFGGATGGNSTTGESMMLFFLFAARILEIIFNHVSLLTLIDQSITVYGYKAVVVNNYVQSQVTPFCSEYFAKLPGVTDALIHECPYIFGSYVNGIEQFELNPLTGAVRSVWSNANVSCTSVVPVLSAANEVFYCIGKRSREVEKLRDVFTVEAIDWRTGRSLYHVKLSPSLLYNGLYAGTIIGTEHDLVMGSLAGVIRLTPGSDDSAIIEDASAISPVWKLFELMGAWNEVGHVPTTEEIEALGLNIRFQVK